MRVDVPVLQGEAKRISKDPFGSRTQPGSCLIDFCFHATWFNQRSKSCLVSGRKGALVQILEKRIYFLLAFLESVKDEEEKNCQVEGSAERI